MKTLCNFLIGARSLDEKWFINRKHSNGFYSFFMRIVITRSINQLKSQVYTIKKENFHCLLLVLFFIYPQ